MRVVLFLLSLSFIYSIPALANIDASQRGREIAEISHSKNYQGYVDSEASLKMTLSNANGDVSVRELTMRSLEVNDDGDKSLVIFDFPMDIKNTALLSHSHTDAADEQWLYLPAIGRVKRIASQNKSGPFVGSEFAYEDLSSQEVEKFTYKLLREENYEDKDCYVIERIPTDKYSGYSRQVVWMDKSEYRNWRIDYYDRKGALLKTLKAGGFKKYEDKFWRPLQLHMENHQTQKATTLEWSNYTFKNGFSNRDFHRNTLLHIR